MIQGFFLDGIHAKTTRPPISREHNLVVFTRPDKAEATIALFEFATARTNIALNPTIIKLVPETCWNRVFWIKILHSA